MTMTNEAKQRAWLSEQCPHVWSLLNSRARKQLPSGLLEYLSPLSEEQLDSLAEVLPELQLGYVDAPRYRQRHAEQSLEEGRQNLMWANGHIEGLIETCGLNEVGDAYRKALSNVATGDQLAELLCEIALCNKGRLLSSTPLRLRPPSGRPGRNTHCDVLFRVEDIAVYGEVKRYPVPSLRERAGTRNALRPIDLYSKLTKPQNVAAQFPEGTVNLVFVFQRSFSGPETLNQALFGWREDLDRPASQADVLQEEDGFFTRPEWRDVSGCCLCQQREGKVQFLALWENPQALISIPPLVHSALSREIV